MELIYNNIKYGEFSLKINISITIVIIKDSTSNYTRNEKNGEITLLKIVQM